MYTFPYLQLGQYEVQVSAKGMKETVIKAVLVDEGNISRVDASLQVGSANETVQVTEQVPTIEQESTTIDSAIDQKLINDLPSVAGGGTRAASDILAILPGVQVPGATTGNSYGSQFGVNVEAISSAPSSRWMACRWPIRALQPTCPWICGQIMT